jgi:hypothetical protein
VLPEDVSHVTFICSRSPAVRDLVNLEEVHFYMARRNLEQYVKQIHDARGLKALFDRLVEISKDLD